MGWKTLKTFHSWQEIQDCHEEVDLPVGTEVRVVYEGIGWWQCLNFDAFWGEWTQNVPAGFNMEDVCCENGNGYVCASVANSSTAGIGGPLLIISALALLAGVVLGLFAFITCKFQALLPAIVAVTKWVAIGAVGVAAAFVLVALVRRG